MAQAGAKACGECGKTLETPLRCSRCRGRWYCSPACQRTNWPRHKTTCHPPSPASSSSPSSSSSTTPPPSSAAATPPRVVQDRVVTQVDRSAGTRRDVAPDPARFPSLLRVFSYVPSPDGLNENLLILLHGLGDTHKNYESLARTMAVPQTCCLALRAPLDLPFELGYGWFPAFNQDDGSLITPTAQERRRLNGLAKAQQLLTDFLAVLEREYDWDPSRIFLLGFSQGAVVAVRLALTFVDKPLGGVIAVSSSLLEEEALTTPLGPITSAAPARTPLLVTHGRRDRVVPLDQARRHLVHVRSRYGAAKAEAEAGGKALVRWKEYEKGHEMIKSREEMQDVMAFLAEHLRLRSVALERRDDLIEVTPGHPHGQ